MDWTNFLMGFSKMAYVIESFLMEICIMSLCKDVDSVVYQTYNVFYHITVLAKLLLFKDLSWAIIWAC